MRYLAIQRELQELWRGTKIKKIKGASMENWRTSLHPAKGREIKIQLIANTFSHSFLLWREHALKIHLQNHPNPILSVLTLVQIYHSHTEWGWTWHGLYICTAAPSGVQKKKKSHHFIYSPALNVQRLLQSPILFSFSGIFFYNLLHFILLEYLPCGSLHANDSTNVSSETFLSQFGNRISRTQSIPSSHPLSAFHRLLSPQKP